MDSGRVGACNRVSVVGEEVGLVSPPVSPPVRWTIKVQALALMVGG